MDHDGGAMAVETELINCTPHHRAMTRSGESHFSHVSDALAEFIDNSIQSCSQVSSPTDIRVSFFLEAKRDKRSYLVVFDSGKGMAQKELTQYATYSLDRETRKLDDGCNEHGSISKFGVGAKQAGFFVADRITVMTKQSGDDSVREVELDEETYDKRYEDSPDDVYQTIIKTRTAKVSSRGSYLDGVSCPNVRIAYEEFEKTHEHFCVTFLRMRTEKLNQLRQTDDMSHLTKTIDELANIYHWFLYPEHLPNRFVESKRMQAASPKRPKIAPLKKPKAVVDYGDRDGENVQPIKLTVSCYSGGEETRTVNLRDYKCGAMYQFYDKAKTAFRFNFTMDDPRATTNELDNAFHSQGVKDKVTVKVLLLYYPFEGEETRPSGNPISLDDVVEIDPDPSNHDATFSVCWAGRLVPMEEVRNLFCFPKANSRPECNKNKIAVNWKHRVKGFLFFSRHFEQISNNKLKLQVYPSLEHHLTNQYKFETFVTKPFKRAANATEFLNWLSSAHQLLDKDVVFSSPAQAGDLVYDEYNEAFPNDPAVIFQEVAVGGNLFTIKVQEFVKLNLTKSGKVSRADSTIKSSLVYGKVKGFVVKGLSTTEISYTGEADLIYFRSPSDVFPEDTLRMIPFAAINCSSSNSAKATINDLDGVIRQAVADLELVVLDEKGGSIKRFPHHPKSRALELGKKYSMFGVRLKSGAKNYIQSVPGSDKSEKYKVSIHYVHETTGEDGKIVGVVEKADSFSKPSKSVWYCESNQKPLELTTVPNTVNEADKLKNSYYCFWDMSIAQSGTTYVVVNVHVGDSVVYEKKFEAVVQAKKVHDFKIEFPDNKDQQVYPFGTLPDFKLIFLDKDGYETQAKLNLVLLFRVKGVKVGVKNGKGDPDDFDADINFDVLNVSSLEIKQELEGDPNDRWRFVCDTTNGPVLSTTNPTKTGLDMMLELYDLQRDTRPGDYSVSVVESIPIGTPKPIPIEFCAAKCEQVKLLSPTPSSPVAVVSEGSLPEILLAIFDKHGHRTAPENDNEWIVLADYGGNFEGPKEAVVSTMGTVTFNGVHDTSESMEVTDYNIEFRCRRATKKKVRYTDYLKVKVQVTPRRMPSSVEILQNGVAPGPEGVVCVAGGVVAGLSLRVLDEDGEEYPITDKMMQPKHAGVKAAWNGNARLRIAPENGRLALPDIEVVGVIPKPREISYEVDVSVGGDPIDALSLTVKLRPAEAVAWNLMMMKPFDGSIVTRDGSDLQRKVLGACLVDKYHNLVESADALPIISLHEADPSVADEMGGLDQGKEIPLVVCGDMQLHPNTADMTRLTRKNLEDLHPDSRAYTSFFALAPDTVVDAPQNAQRVWLKVASGPGSKDYEQQTCELKVQAGRPYQVLVQSASLNIDEPTNQASCEVETGSNFRDLVITLQDRAGNVADLASKSTLWVKDANTYLMREKNVKENPFSLKEFKMRDLGMALQAAREASDGVSSGSGSGKEVVLLSIGMQYMADNEKLEQCLAAELRCTLIKTNSVEGILLNLLDPDRPVEMGTVMNMDEEPAEVRQEVVVGQPFPTFTVKTLTQDNVKYLPDADAYRISINKNKNKNKNKKKKKKSMSNLRRADFYADGVGDDETACMRFSCVEGLEVKEPGEYTVDVKYVENRPAFFGPVNMAEAVFVVDVRAGPYHRLRSKPDVSAMSLSAAMSEETCSIVQDLCIYPEDIFGNAAEVPEELQTSLVCGLVREGGPPGLTMPRLEGADPSSGALRAQWNASHGYFEFESIALERDVGEGGGSIDMVFRFDVAAAGALAGPQLKAKFSFISSAQVAQQVKVLQEQLCQAETKHSEMNSARARAKATYDKEVTELATTMRSVKCEQLREELLVLVRSRTRGIRKDELYEHVTRDDVATKLNEVKAQMAAALAEVSGSSVRATVRPGNLASMRLLGNDAIGYVVGLAQVDDVQDARMISWAMQQKMEVCVFKKRGEDSTAAYGRHIRSWSLDDIGGVFTITNQGRRTHAQQEAGKLPEGGGGLKPITWNKSGPVPGNPRYMVNELRLSPELEHLRDSVFWVALGNTLLFDTMASANQYRDYVVREVRGRAPPIYALTGECIMADGIRDPRKGQGKLPDNLRCVFGQPPPSGADNADALERKLVILDIVEERLRKRDLAWEDKTRADKNQDALKDLDADIESLYGKLEKLGVISPQSSQATAMPASLALDGGRSPTQTKKRSSQADGADSLSKRARA